ncbi:MAG: DnaA/Hda family protein [Gemmatimonadota bacterium]|nr:DnaA/Hda family protein [Gemmatimonadota bacterium]
MSTAHEGVYRFENFVIGSSNRLAAAAARKVGDAPGTAYNPLFLYGSPGLGKTHLVAAIAYHARQAQPALRVEFSTGEQVVERLHRAIAAGQPETFQQRYQTVDLLLLDDVQFFTGHRETQNELLKLFNLMQGRGRQLVMTSDRPPEDIRDVDQRLLSRLSGGLIADIGAPDFEMRLAILRNSCAERAFTFGDGVLEEVARLPFGNVRELKGALNRLTAYQEFDGSDLNATDVRAVLGDRIATTIASIALPATGERLDAAGAEYQGFLDDVTEEVHTRVEKWRIHLGEACAFWRSEGYSTEVLERAIALHEAPDVNGLLATFTAAIEHLKGLELQAVSLDPSLRGKPEFRNPTSIPQAQLIVDRALASAMPLPMALPAYTRSGLEAGASIQLALKAFDAVVANPGERYNPLFLHGPSGVGKTHIAHAMGNALRTGHPRLAVACLSAGTFVEELIAALQEGGVERWRARYRAADVLILDDVHLFSDKERTQEELFHLFNPLYDRGCQIVLTADRPPREMHGLADRLRSRFEGGLVVALQGPDRALRQRLISRWLLESGHDPLQSLVNWLADRDVTSVRELAGAVTQLTAHADLQCVPLTVELARSIMEGTPTAVAIVSEPVSELSHIDDFFQDTEKVLWDWPELSGRLIEELR